MNELEPPDSFHWLAATGWLELGNHIEAAGELTRIAPRMQAHPDVLEVKWEIAARAQEWTEALAVAERLQAAAPERPSAWIHQAYAMRRAPGHSLDEARRVLLGVADKFPKEPIIPYNLACYDAQSGRLSEAWDWLHRAMEAAGDVDRIKRMALQDPDLAPLRARIESL